MPNFTPGPWKMNDNGHFIEVNADPIDKDRPLDVYSPAVAFAWDVGDNTAQANAQLIASAPDMYAALNDLRIRYIGLFDAYARKTYAASSNPDDDLHLALIDTDAALAKVDGKQAPNAL